MTMRSGSVPVATAATTADESFRLESEPGPRWNGEPENEYLLPPADGGKEAWSFLGAAFAIEIMVWGKSALTTDSSVFLVFLRIQG